MFFRSKVTIAAFAIERDLIHPSERVRQAAVRELGRVSPDFPDLAKKIERAAVDVSPFVRTTAMYSLLEQNLETSLRDTVLQALNDSASRVREAAVIALVHLDDETAHSHLAQLLDDADPAVRHAALLSVAEKQFFDFRERMEHILTNDPDDEVRAAAAAALGECRPLPQEVLQQAAVSDSSLDVRFESAISLAQAGVVGSATLLVPFLAYGHMLTDVVEPLCHLADVAVHDPVKCLYERRFQPVAHKLLLGALLCRLGDECARTYIEKKTRALFQETRVWAIYALGLSQTSWARTLLEKIVAKQSGTQEAETAADALATFESVNAFVVQS